MIVLGCGEKDTEQPAEVAESVPVVFASNYPLHYFVERMASGLVEVQFPASAAGDPSSWTPTPEAITAMQQADLVFLNGASYEQWLTTVSLAQSKLIDTAAGFEDRFLASEETVTHSHGPEGEHEHQGTAFTTWMDLTLATEQARAVKTALATLLPEHTSHLDEQLAQLEGELSALDAELKAAVASNPERHVFFSHPVYQYFQDRYGIAGTSVHWEPDAMPDEAMWRAFAHELDHNPSSWMLWEGEPLPEIVERLKEFGVESAVVDPTANTPENGDFLSVMQHNAQELKRVFE